MTASRFSANLTLLCYLNDMVSVSPCLSMFTFFDLGFVSFGISCLVGLQSSLIFFRVWLCQTCWCFPCSFSLHLDTCVCVNAIVSFTIKICKEAKAS